MDKTSTYGMKGGCNSVWQIYKCKVRINNEGWRTELAYKKKKEPESGRFNLSSPNRMHITTSGAGFFQMGKRQN